MEEGRTRASAQAASRGPWYTPVIANGNPRCTLITVISLPREMQKDRGDCFVSGPHGVRDSTELLHSA